MKIRVLSLVFLVASTVLGMSEHIEQKVEILDQETLNLVVLEEFKKIVSEYEQRLFSVRATQDPKALLKSATSGSWYASDYYELLNRPELSNTQSVKVRLNWMKEKGSFTIGMSTSKKMILKSIVNGDLLFAYELSSTAKASDAVRNFGSELILIDCAIAYQLAFYRAALIFLGEERFDAIFSGSSRLLFAAKTEKTKIAPFLKFLDSSTKQPVQGAVAHINGHPFYQYKNLYDEGRGFNVMLSGYEANEPLFIGLGLTTSGSTKEQVQNELVRYFNKVPLNANLVSPKIWSNRPTAESPLNVLFIEYFRDLNVESINDQSMMGDLSAKLFQKFGQRGDVHMAIEGLTGKFTNGSGDLEYFVMQFDELFKLL